MMVSQILLLYVKQNKRALIKFKIPKTKFKTKLSEKLFE